MIRAFDIACVVGCALVFALAPVRADDQVPQVVTGAMQFLGVKTEAPHWAPRSLPRLSGELAKYYVTDVDARRTAYKVHLYVCDRQSAIGHTDPVCRSAKNGPFGNFGVTVYRSAADARRTFENLAGADCFGLKRDRSPVTVAIRDGVRGELWADGTHAPILRWRYRDWRFGLCWIGELSGDDTVAEARALLKLLERYPPPSSTGYMVVSVTGDDINTRAVWLDHQSIVETWSPDPIWGVPLASAMRRWR